MPHILHNKPVTIVVVVSCSNSSSNLALYTIIINSSSSNSSNNNNSSSSSTTNILAWVHAALYTICLVRWLLCQYTSGQWVARSENMGQLVLDINNYLFEDKLWTFLHFTLYKRHSTHGLLRYTYCYFHFYAHFLKWQIRFGEHRKSKSNRIWNMFHIRLKVCRSRPTEYVTCVTYTFRAIYGPT